MRKLRGWLAASTCVALTTFLVVFLLNARDRVTGQPPGEGKKTKKNDSQGLPKIKGSLRPLDEEKEILNEIKDAYKAPLEVHADVLKELRRSYQQPSIDREAKIFKEIRRLYDPTPEQEAAILRELRRAYEVQTPEQEQRFFSEMGNATPLRTGAVPASVQVSQARKIFQKLDLNGDGVLSGNEMPEPLRVELSRWDRNGDGVIDQNEYWDYYQSRLQGLGQRVASGEIDLGLKKSKAAVSPAFPVEKDKRPIVYRNGKLPPDLPAWFRQLDTNRDGQVSLYEWKQSGHSFADFASMDLNRDGFITIAELQRIVMLQAQAEADKRAQDVAFTIGAKEGQ